MMAANSVANAVPFLGVMPGKKAGAAVLWLDFERRKNSNASRFIALNIDATRIFSMEPPAEGEHREQT